MCRSHASLPIPQAKLETIFRDITGPTHPLQWWEARPASPFRERVLFLISMVMGTSSVERVFSFRKYTTLARGIQ